MAKNQQLREDLEKAYTQLLSAHLRIQQAQERDPGLCSGFPSYGGVKQELNGARKLLDRKTYRVAVAGMMSAGKSTLTNALLESPGLLPTGNEETTLTITVITKPEERPGISIEYLSRDDAIRGIFERGNYVGELERVWEKGGQTHSEIQANLRRLRAASPDEQLEEIQRLTENTELEDKVRRQLGGFLKALEEHKAVLGSTVYKEFSDKRKLLASTNDEELGHLLLIAKGILFVDTQLFTRKGIEFVDLPGADSTNDRQQRIAYEFLQDTDLLLSVPNSSGFRKIDMRLMEQFGKARGDIRNRVFFVVNRFDETKIRDLPDSERSLKYLRGFVDYASQGFNPANIFFTASLWDALAFQLNRGEDLGKAQTDHDQVKTGCLALIDHFEHQGVLSKIEKEWDDRYAGRVVESLRALREQGGVPRLRRELISYLEEQMERERLKEVRAYLARAERIIEGLLEPERAGVEGVMNDAREQLRATGAYLEKVVQDTHAALEKAYEDLSASKEPGGEPEYGFKQVMDHFSKWFFKEKITPRLAKGSREVDFRRVMRENHGGTQAIMREIIDLTRTVLSKDFVELMATTLAPEFVKRFNKHLAGLDNEKIFTQLGVVLAMPSLAERYAARLEEMRKALILVSRVRALEETWVVGKEAFNPNPGSKPFDQLADEFREALTAEMKSVWGARFKSLQGVLLKYYRVVIDDFMRECEVITDDAKITARQTAATLPAELLFDKASLEERRRYGLAELVSAADGARDAMSASKELVG